MELNLSQRLDFDPSKLQIHGINKEAIYQLRILDFFSFPAALILSHLEFSFLYEKSYLDHFLQALQQLNRNSQFPYWMNFMNGFKAEGMNFLDEKTIDSEFISELKALVLACGAEMKADKLNILNSSLILARKFYFTVEIIYSKGRSTIMNSVGTEMCIPVFLYDQGCSIAYPLVKYYKQGIKDIAKTPKRKFITLACGDEVEKDDIESSLIIGRNIICRGCNRNLYEQEKAIIEELIKLPQKRQREQEVAKNNPQKNFSLNQKAQNPASYNFGLKQESRVEHQENKQIYVPSIIHSESNLEYPNNLVQTEAKKQKKSKDENLESSYNLAQTEQKESNDINKKQSDYGHYNNSLQTGNKKINENHKWCCCCGCTCSLL